MIRLLISGDNIAANAVVKIRTTGSTENKQIMFMIVSTSLHNKTFALQIYIESNNNYSVIMNHNFIILNIKCMTPSSSSILHKLVVISFSSFSYNRIINYVSMCMFFLVWSQRGRGEYSFCTAPCKLQEITVSNTACCVSYGIQNTLQMLNILWCF